VHRLDKLRWRACIECMVGVALIAAGAITQCITDMWRLALCIAVGGVVLTMVGVLAYRGIAHRIRHGRHR